MPPSIGAVLRLLPPARRLLADLAQLNDSVTWLRQSHDAAAYDIGELRHHLALQTDRLAATQGQLTAAERRVAAAEHRLAAADERQAVAVQERAAAEAERDRHTVRMFGEAARRFLPVIGGEFRDDEGGIVFNGYCGAPDGVTAGMAFFLNGRRMDQVRYPALDSVLKERFADIAGMGFSVSATITHDLEALRAERFWRFDASPTGHPAPDRWQQAVYCLNPAFERFPFPPAAQMERVVSEASRERFAIGGSTIFQNATRIMETLGTGWADYGDVLDWGCGAGRLTRYLIGETRSRVVGADVDPDNIAWCQRSYPGGTFVTLPLRPPTSLPTGGFDLVFGISVMTHLQEADQWLWLYELHRITRPGALVLLSIRGPAYFGYNAMAPAQYRALESEGFVDVSRDGSLDDVIEDKDYYRAVLHSRDYVLTRWSAYFEVVTIIDGVAAIQDFVVLRRRRG